MKILIGFSIQILINLFKKKKLNSFVFYTLYQPTI